MKVVYIPAEEIVTDNRVPWMYDIPEDTLYYSDDGSEHTPLMQHAGLFRGRSLEELQELEERYVFGIYIPSEHKALDIEGPPNFPVDRIAEQLTPQFAKTSSVQWFQNNDYTQFPMAETQPFIYIPETQQLHMGNPGGHHWEIFNKDIDHTGLYGLYNPVRNNAMLYPLDQQGNRENIDISAENFMTARRAINSMLAKQSAKIASTDVKFIYNPETKDIKVWTTDAEGNPTHADGLMDSGWHWPIVPGGVHDGKYYVMAEGPLANEATRAFQEAEQKTSAWEDPDELYNRLAALFVL